MNFNELGIEGLTPVDPKDLEEYERAMEETIPQIVAEIQHRAQLAADARNRVLF